MKVVINGFGRIGRTVLRAWLQGGWPDVQIVGINDIADAETCAYLFEYDSVFGRMAQPVSAGDGLFRVGDASLRLTHKSDLSELDLSGIDLVMECTGRADRTEVARRGIRAGARRVLISGPSDAAEVTIVLGANDDVLTPDHALISNASCTTNALAPLAKFLHDRWGIATGFMTTVHCYTGSQPTVDAPRGDLARSRAAAL
ncbi:MAG: aldehyde dehydrogenase, partial [Alphaproteobacteria bacterium]|nr:aldehyde dehydrogenase [Alphaproteobacteria bacterium]